MSALGGHLAGLVGERLLRCQLCIVARQLLLPQWGCPLHCHPDLSNGSRLRTWALDGRTGQVWPLWVGATGCATEGMESATMLANR
jgi:hypothetical protein